MFRVEENDSTSLIVRAGLHLRYVGGVEFDVGVDVGGRTSIDPDDTVDVTGITVTQWIYAMVDDVTTPTSVSIGATGSDAVPTAGDQSVLPLARVICVDGKIDRIVPAHEGIWEVGGGGMAVDLLSIDMNEFNEAQIFNWDNASGEDLSMFDWASALMPVQGDALSLHYLNLGQLYTEFESDIYAYVLEQSPWPGTYLGLSDTPSTYPETEGTWVPYVNGGALDWLDLGGIIPTDYWPQGQDYDECYGLAIGNADGSDLVIDLVNNILDGSGPWTVSDDTESTGTDDGALVVGGGIGIAADGYFGGGVSAVDGFFLDPAHYMTPTDCYLEPSGMFTVSADGDVTLESLTAGVHASGNDTTVYAPLGILALEGGSFAINGEPYEPVNIIAPIVSGGPLHSLTVLAKDNGAI